VVGYGPGDQRRRFSDEQNAVLPYYQTGATKQDADLHVGSAAQVDTVLFTRTITLPGSPQNERANRPLRPKPRVQPICTPGTTIRRVFWLSRHVTYSSVARLKKERAL
jgi:hypothetical protein